MTRFQKELRGEMGEFWKANAQNELAEAKRKFESADVVDGVVRWKTNGHVIMDDMAEKMELAGCEFDRAKCREVREREKKAFIEEYSKNQQNKKLSEEEIFEMLSAFGPGIIVVDVLSGNTYNL